MEFKIDRLDHQGRGIAIINGKVTFVDGGLPEEIVNGKIIEEKKNYNLAVLKDIIKTSKKRVEPICPYFNSCGGCQLQHLSYEDTLEFKKEKVKSILNREKIVYPNILVVANPSYFHYRNKITLKVENGNIGFYEEKTHSLISINSCKLAKKSINDCLSYLKFFDIKNGSITIRSNYNDELLIILNTNDDVTFNENDFKNLKLVGVILNKKTIYGNNFFYERMNNHLFKVSYDAFFQINPFITNKLFSLLEENLDLTNIVLDLYSGVGTLGIIASQKAKKVYSIEIVKNAVLDNIENKKINKKDNIFPMLGDAEKVLPKIQDNFDTIIIDPPRKGLDKNSLKLILDSNANKVIYISCDPMTLARDLKSLTNKYEIKKYYVLDMFSYTSHVESLCVLKLK